MGTRIVGKWGNSKALRLTEELNYLGIDYEEELSIETIDGKLTNEKYIVIKKLALKEKNERE